MDCTQRIVEEVGISRKKVGTLYILGTNYSIFSGINNIGRDPDKSDIYIDNPTISKNHAVIRNFEDQHVILDLGSTNKTIIDAKAPLIPYDHYHLRHDCPVQFGEILGTYYHEQDDSDSRSGGGSPVHVRPTNPIEKILDRNVDDMFNSSNGDLEDYLICPSSPIIDSSCSKRWEKSKSTKRSEDSESIHSAETQISVEEREFLKKSKPKLSGDLTSIHEADTQIPNNQGKRVNNEAKPRNSPSPNSFSDRLRLSEGFNESNPDSLEIQSFKRFSSSFCIPETQDARNSLLKSNTSNNISIAESHSDSIIGEIPYVDHDDSNDVINYKEDTNSSDCNYENISSQCLLRSYTALPKFDDSSQENKSAMTTKSIPKTDDPVDPAISISKNCVVDVEADEELTDCEDVELEPAQGEKSTKYKTKDDQETQIISDVDLTNAHDTGVAGNRTIIEDVNGIYDQSTQAVPNSKQRNPVAGTSTNVSNIEDTNSIFDQPTQAVPNLKQRSPVAGSSTKVSDNEDTNNIFDQLTQAVPNSKQQSPVAGTSTIVSDIDDMNSIFDQPTQAVPNTELQSPISITSTIVSDVVDMNSIYDQMTQAAPNIKLQSPISISSTNASDVDDPNSIFGQRKRAVLNLKKQSPVAGTSINVSNIEDTNSIYDQLTQAAPIIKLQSPISITSTNPSDVDDLNSIFEQPTQAVPNSKQRSPVAGTSTNVSDIEDTNSIFDQLTQAVPNSKQRSPVAGTSTNVSDVEDLNSIYDQPTQAVPNSTRDRDQFDEEELFNMPTQAYTGNNVLMSEMLRRSTSNTPVQKSSSSIIDLCENANSDADNETVIKQFSINEFYNETTQIYPGLENTIKHETEELKQSVEKSLIEIEAQLNAEKEDTVSLDFNTDSEIGNETKNRLSIKENTKSILTNVKKLTCSTPIVTTATKNRNSKKDISKNKENVFDEQKACKSDAMSLQLSPINDDHSNYEEVLYEDTEAVMTAENSMKMFASKLSNKDKPRPTPKELFGDSSEGEFERIAVPGSIKRHRKGPVKTKKVEEKVLSTATRKSSRPRKKVKYFDEICDEPGPSVEDTEDHGMRNKTGKTFESLMPRVPGVKHNIMIKSVHSTSVSSLLTEPDKIPARSTKLCPILTNRVQEPVLKSKLELAEHNTSGSSLLREPDKIPATRSINMCQLPKNRVQELVLKSKSELGEHNTSGSALLTEPNKVPTISTKLCQIPKNRVQSEELILKSKSEHNISGSSLLTEPNKITARSTKCQYPKNITQSKEPVLLPISEQGEHNIPGRSLLTEPDKIPARPTRYLRKKQSESPEKSVITQHKRSSRPKTSGAPLKTKAEENNIASPHTDKIYVVKDNFLQDKTGSAMVRLNEYKKEYKKSTRNSNITEIQNLEEDQTNKVKGEEKNIESLLADKINVIEHVSHDKTHRAVVYLKECQTDYKKSTRHAKVTGIQNLGDQTYKVKVDAEETNIAQADKMSVKEDHVAQDKTRTSSAYVNQYKKEYKKSTRHAKITEIQNLGQDQTYNINTRPSRQQTSPDHTKVGNVVEKNETLNMKEIDGTAKRRASKRTHTEIDKNENANTQAGLPKSKKKNVGDKDVTQNQKISPTRVSIRNEKKCKFRILFTSVNDENLVRLVNVLGGSVVDSHDKCSILVAPRIIRTVKFLCCLTKGIPIVSADWLIESSKANKFLDPWLFITSDKAGEAKYKFDLKKSLKRALAAPLLKGFTVMGTESIIPQPKETEDIVKSSGGSFVYSVPIRGFKEPAFIISCEKDKKHWPKNGKKYTPPVVKAECLLTGILQQRLNLDQHILTV